MNEHKEDLSDEADFVAALIELEQVCRIQGSSFSDVLKSIPGTPSIRTFRAWKKKYQLNHSN